MANVKQYNDYAFVNNQNFIVNCKIAVYKLLDEYTYWMLNANNYSCVRDKNNILFLTSDDKMINLYGVENSREIIELKSGLKYSKTYLKYMLYRYMRASLKFFVSGTCRNLQSNPKNTLMLDEFDRFIYLKYFKNDIDATIDLENQDYLLSKDKLYGYAKSEVSNDISDFMKNIDVNKISDVVFYYGKYSEFVTSVDQNKIDEIFSKRNISFGLKKINMFKNSEVPEDKYFEEMPKLETYIDKEIRIPVIKLWEEGVVEEGSSEYINRITNAVINNSKKLLTKIVTEYSRNIVNKSADVMNKNGFLTRSEFLDIISGKKVLRINIVMERSASSSFKGRIISSSLSKKISFPDLLDSFTELDELFEILKTRMFLNESFSTSDANDDIVLDGKEYVELIRLLNENVDNLSLLESNIIFKFYIVGIGDKQPVENTFENLRLPLIQFIIEWRKLIKDIKAEYVKILRQKVVENPLASKDMTICKCILDEAKYIVLKKYLPKGCYIATTMLNMNSIFQYSVSGFNDFMNNNYPESNMDLGFKVTESELVIGEVIDYEVVNENNPNNRKYLMKFKLHSNSIGILTTTLIRINICDFINFPIAMNNNGDIVINDSLFEINDRSILNKYSFLTVGNNKCNYVTKKGRYLGTWSEQKYMSDGKLHKRSTIRPLMLCAASKSTDDVEYMKAIERNDFRYIPEIVAPLKSLTEYVFKSPFFVKVDNVFELAVYPDGRQYVDMNGITKNAENLVILDMKDYKF